VSKPLTMTVEREAWIREHGAGVTPQSWQPGVTMLRDLQAEIDALRAALAAAEARIAALEAELAAQRDRAAECLFERNEAQAHANALRDALADIADSNGCEIEGCTNRNCIAGKAAKAALAQTPAASLAAHDAEVLERAASICDKARAIAAGRTDDRSTVKASMYELVEYIVTECADHIRALAAQEVKP